MVDPLIIDAMSVLLGKPFVPERHQNIPLAKGVTAEAVARSLPMQIADLRQEVAEGIRYTLTGKIDGWQDILPLVTADMVADLVVLDRPITGFASNDERFQSDRLDIEEAIEIGRGLVMDELARLHWLFRVYRTYTNALPDREGYAFWMWAIYDDREERDDAAQIAHEARMKAKMIAGFARNG